MKGEDEENVGGENKKKVGTKDEENIGGEDEESIEVEDRIMTMIEELRTCGNGQKHSAMIPPYLLLHITKAGPTQAAKSRDTPLEFIIRIFLDKLVDVVTETNVYAAQNGFNVTFTKEDILGYLGMNIAMGIVGLPELQDYWT